MNANGIRNTKRDAYFVVAFQCSGRWDFRVFVQTTKTNDIYTGRKKGFSYVIYL